MSQKANENFVMGYMFNLCENDISIVILNRILNNSNQCDVEQRRKHMDKEMTVNGKSYTIIKLLGKGKGGYSYLAESGNNRYVLKQIHHEPCDYYQFGNKLEAEIRDYKKLKEIGIKMPAMLETDVKNERILKEFIDGDTIYQLVLEDKMKTDYIEQLHRMCALLYAANTNIDYFPTNFVVHNEEIYYVDFECNDYMEEWNFENWGVKYWSKTPEFLQYVKEHSSKAEQGKIASTEDDTVERVEKF